MRRKNQFFELPLDSVVFLNRGKLCMPDLEKNQRLYVTTDEVRVPRTLSRV